MPNPAETLQILEPFQAARITRIIFNDPEAEEGPDSYPIQRVFVDIKGHEIDIGHEIHEIILEGGVFKWQRFPMDRKSQIEMIDDIVIRKVALIETDKKGTVGVRLTIGPVPIKDVYAPKKVYG